MKAIRLTPAGHDAQISTGECCRSCEHYCAYTIGEGVCAIRKPRGGGLPIYHPITASSWCRHYLPRPDFQIKVTR